MSGLQLLSPDIVWLWVSTHLRITMLTEDCSAEEDTGPVETLWESSDSPCTQGKQWGGGISPPPAGDRPGISRLVLHQTGTGNRSQPRTPSSTPPAGQSGPSTGDRRRGGRRGEEGTDDICIVGWKAVTVTGTSTLPYSHCRPVQQISDILSSRIGHVLSSLSRRLSTSFQSYRDILLLLLATRPRVLATSDVFQFFNCQSLTTPGFAACFLSQENFKNALNIGFSSSINNELERPTSNKRKLMSEYFQWAFCEIKIYCEPANGSWSSRSLQLSPTAVFELQLR